MVRCTLRTWVIPLPCRAPSQLCTCYHSFLGHFVKRFQGTGRLKQKWCYSRFLCHFLKIRSYDWGWYDAAVVVLYFAWRVEKLYCNFANCDLVTWCAFSCSICLKGWEVSIQIPGKATFFAFGEDVPGFPDVIILNSSCEQGFFFSDKQGVRIGIWVYFFYSWAHLMTPLPKEHGFLIIPQNSLKFSLLTCKFPKLRRS